MLASMTKVVFFALIVRPFILLGLGLNVVQRERLPRQGPAVLVANHNSHLDTLVLMALMPLRQLTKVRPVAAADYFLRSRWLSWFSLKVIGIIPLRREAGMDKATLFDGCHEALQAGHILILFPEGSRGAPEVMQPLKKGLYHLVCPYPGLRIVPIVMHGLGKTLPKGDLVPVPFNCDVVVGQDIPVSEKKEGSDAFMAQLQSAFAHQATLCLTRTERPDISGSLH